MPRKSADPKERHHVHLYEGDWARLTEIYEGERITPSGVIAKLVRFHIKRIEEKANILASRNVPEVEAPTIEDLSDV